MFLLSVFNLDLKPARRDKRINIDNYIILVFILRKKQQ